MMMASKALNQNDTGISTRLSFISSVLEEVFGFVVR